jgi:hypothetical protein
MGSIGKEEYNEKLSYEEQRQCREYLKSMEYQKQKWGILCMEVKSI